MLVAAIALRSAGSWAERGWRMLPALVLALAVAALLAGRAGPALSVPVAINAMLLATFALSLLRGEPLVERFARMRNRTLSPAQVRYCRAVTIAWCVFFVVNGAIAASLAAFAPLAWWAVFTGGISYGFVGLMFAVEYVVRALRFPASTGWLGSRIAVLRERGAARRH